MARETFYITTPIYYVNDLPHIGHIYTTVVADTIARYKRMRGFDVRFLTGTDEHGQKIDRAAQRPGHRAEGAGRPRRGPLPRALEAARHHPRRLHPHHRAAPPRRRPRAHRAHEKPGATSTRARYEGWYCAGCEAFFPETQLVDGKCPDQGHPVELLKEESYFFRLSAYQEPLLDFYRENPECIRPASRYNEVVRFVEMRPQGPLDLARLAEVGDPVARATRARRLRLARRPDQLHLGARLRLGGRPRSTSATGPPTCTSSARTSCASTASTGRRS